MLIIAFSAPDDNPEQNQSHFIRCRGLYSADPAPLLTECRNTEKPFYTYFNKKIIYRYIVPAGTDENCLLSIINKNVEIVFNYELII